MPTVLGPAAPAAAAGSRSLPHGIRRRRLAAAIALLLPLLVATAPAAAAPEPLPYGGGDAGGGETYDILPPGTNGTTPLVPLLGMQLAGVGRPAHNDDQFRPYQDLIRATPGLRRGQIGTYFADSTFGIPSGSVERQYSPRPDVTILRDKQYAIPRVYGADRDGVMFGAGWVGAEDRLFMMDVLRHVGRGELSSFAGGAPGNRSFEVDQWANAPYTEADLQRQVDQFDDLYGAEGARIQRDLHEYIAGVNAYIGEARGGQQTMPGEYAAIGRPAGPEPFRESDVVAIASLVGGIFGKGGGNEIGAVRLLQSFQQRFGSAEGRRLWGQLAAYDDPDAPTTVKPGPDAIRRSQCAARLDAVASGALSPRRARIAAARAAKRRRSACTAANDQRPSATWFPYQRPVRTAGGDRAVLPDPGSLRTQAIVTAGPDRSAQEHAATSRGAGLRDATEPSRALRGGPGLREGLIPTLGPSMSNALLVSGRHTDDGRPLAVFGPQVSYFAPQILMQSELQGGGVSARGASFPGINMYVELGRGTDYAWSATSAGQDIIDSFALPLCEPGGGAPTTASMSYRYQGRCRPIEVLRRTNSWTPSLGDATPAGTQTMEAQRTALGIVRARGTVAGKPYAFTVLRSTYMHEVDSAVGFARFNQPALIRDVRSFVDAASHIGYTFNWFYADDRDIGYYNSGWNPKRQPGTTGQLPMAADDAWQGYDPATLLSQREPQANHPQVIDQDYITSWNNRQAQGFAGGDNNLFSSVFRSQLLDRQLDLRLASGDRRIALPEAVDAMSVASTTDLRGQEDLPLALDLLGDVSGEDATVRGAVAALRSWQHDGWHRIDRDDDGRYEHADAIRIMDAWWPRWVAAQFGPTLGTALLDDLRDFHEIDNAPNNHGAHQGSAYQNGWYGYVAKDLRQTLGRRVRQPYARTFCGGGDRGACRRALIDSLRAAARLTTAQVYPRDAVCAKKENAALDPQWCFDAILFRPLGGATQPLMDWQNRPTYQQVIQFRAHRTRPGG